MIKPNEQKLLLSAKHIERKLPENYKPGELDFCKAEFAYDTNDVYKLGFNGVYLNASGHSYNANFEVIEASLINPANFERQSFFKHIRKVVLKRKRRLHINERYLFCFDEWANNHYHWVCDFLPRLSVIENELHNYTLLLPDTKYIKSVGITLLKVFGLMPKRIEWIRHKELVRVPHLQLITHPLLSGRIHDELINRVKARLNYNGEFPCVKPNRRIYISRAKAAHRKVLNEDKVILLLQEFNFEILNFEDLSIQQQISLSQETAILVSIHGAGLTNAIFMQPQTAVLEFRRDKVYHNQCFWHLSSSLGLKYYYLFGQPDKDTVIEGPQGCNLTIPIDGLRMAIENMI